MALTSTIYNATIALSDVDRSVYESLELRLAMHPSETIEYMVTRLLAYCLEYEEGIEFTSGLSNGDEPAIVIRDLTGRVRGWIEVGMPDADRLHRASKAADRVAVYTHRDLRNLMTQLAKGRIHRVEEIPIYTFGRGFIGEVASHVERRNDISVSVTERHIYFDINGTSLTTIIEDHRITTG
jgi:uncharacterized protein YaeQ